MASLELQLLPNDVFNVVIERLVERIGILKSIRLRRVSRAFDSAIRLAIFTTQVVDVYDPAHPMLLQHMTPEVKAHLLLVKSRSLQRSNNIHLAELAYVNDQLDNLTGVTGPQQQIQHQMVAEAFGCHLTLPQCPQELSDFEATKNLLCGAIVLGCIPLVKSLLEKPQTSSPMDLDTCCNGFGFPLSLAAAWGHIEIVSYLIKKGANPRRCEVYRDKPWRNGEHFRSIRAGRGRDAWNSALSAAAYGGHEEIVELLMKPENRISPLTLEYFTSIIAAARGGHWGIIQRLLRDTGKSIQDHAERLITECFWEAVYNNHQHVVQMLLDSGADIDKFPCTRYYFGYYTNALGIASSLGNLTMFRFLIERGANPTHCKIQPRWFSPIYCASRCGHEEIVGQLLDLGADPATALYGACDGGQVHLVKLLFERYPDIPSRKRFGDVSHGLPVGLEVLRLAIRIKNPSLISFLVRKGVSLNDGYPEPRFLPIVIAKTESAKWITQHLLSLGAVDQELPEDCKQHNVERYLEEIPEFNYDRMYHFNYRQRGGVMITKRTWEWVGNR